jgi:nucleotide-binding universal stress UspA family protein
MKTILVPTDFSKVAENAANYAVEIATLMKAKVILFHSYRIPVVTTEVPIVMPSLAELEKDCMEGLQKIAAKLHSKHINLNVECVVKCGFAVEDINQFAEDQKADLIVMGMQGAGFLTEKIIGSVTTSLIQQSKCPVLAISKGVKFKSIKKIVLACDYNETENAKIFEPMKEFARLFKSHIYVFNVEREIEHAISTQDVVSDFMKLEHSLVDTNHTFHYGSNEDVVDGINEFVDKMRMDMVVVIPRKHSTLKNIFQESNTKRMAFHSHAPLLALH